MSLEDLKKASEIFEAFDAAKAAALAELKRRGKVFLEGDEKMRNFIVKQCINAGINHLCGLTRRGEHDTHKLYILYSSGVMRPYKKGDYVCLECGEVGICEFNVTKPFGPKSTKCWQCGRFPLKSGVIHKVGDTDVAVCKCGAHYSIPGV